MWVDRVLGRPVTGPQGQHLGHVRDVAVRWPAVSRRPHVCGLVVDAGGVPVLATADAVRAWEGEQVLLGARPLRHLGGQSPGAVLLVASVFRQPVLTGNGTVSRVADVALRRATGGWVVWAVDTRSAAGRLLGLPRRVTEWDVLAGRRLAPVPR